MQPTTRLKQPAGSRNDVLTVGVSDRVYETTKLGAAFADNPGTVRVMLSS